jgi:hypothetical protein
MREAKLAGYKIEVLKDLYIASDHYYMSEEFRLLIEEFFRERTPMGKINAVRLLIDRLAYFVNYIVPTIYAYAAYYEQLFEKKEYKVICFDRRNKLYQYGALIAARRIGLKSIYFRHGWDAYDIEDRADKWLRCFDYFVSDVQLDYSLFKQVGEQKGYKAQVIGGENGT